MLPSWIELLIIFGVILLFFGASRLPKIARSMGESVGEFKDGLKQGGDGPDELEADSDREQEAEPTDDDDEVPTDS